MKVVILTSSPHWKFVDSILSQHKDTEHEFWLSEALAIPNNYDVGISFMFQHKIPKDVVTSHPWINFHPGLLPDYKGRNLCYHAIMNGAKRFGATLHYMDENFDTGDIITTLEFPIDESDTAEEVSEKTIKNCKRLFVSYMPRIVAGEKFDRKPNRGGTYYRKLPISDSVSLDHDVPLSRFIRAVSYKEFHPYLEIGGVRYEVVRVRE